MESKENNDVFNHTANTIIKWYEQTSTSIITKSLTRPNLDSELLGILLAAKSQTSGALTTLGNNHILSTHGLLRILFETYAVLRWALNVTASDEKTKSDETYKRLLSWDLERLYKDKALLEEQRQTPQIKLNLEQIKSDIHSFEKADIKKLPCVQQLYSDLGNGWEGVYTIFYRRYSRAVHINRNITQELAWIQYEGERPKETLYKNDIEPDGDELKNIASISCDINKAIRDFYDWNSDVIQHEYEQIKSRLEKNKFSVCSVSSVAK